LETLPAAENYTQNLSKLVTVAISEKGIQQFSSLPIDLLLFLL